MATKAPEVTNIRVMVQIVLFNHTKNIALIGH